MSWLRLLATLTNELQQSNAIVKEEEVARLSLIVEERSVLAHIRQKLRAVLKGHEVSSDDEDATKAGAKEPTSSLLLKYKLVAERRQVEWDLFEDRARALRREYEISGDGRILDELAALKRPNMRKRPVSAAPRTKAALVDDAGANVAVPSAVTDSSSPPTRGPGDSGTSPTNGCAHHSTRRILPPLVQSPAPPPPQPAQPQWLVSLLQGEGFARAGLLMEERANRAALAQALRISLIEGDDELRAKQWNRECYTRELDTRQAQREATAADLREQQFRDMAHRHRAIATSQTNRVFLKKMLRERRVALQFTEGEERTAIAEEWAKWFDISIIYRNFGSLLRILPLEEASARGAVARRENQAFHLMVRMQRYLHHGTAMELECIHAVEDAFDTETFYMRRHIEMFQKQMQEEELATKRREAQRKAQQAEEVEEMKLAAKYGALSLKERPAADGSGPRLCLTPTDELEIIIATHPPQNITDAVRRATRVNQENNSLFMALEKKYIRVGKGSDGSAAATQPAAEDPGGILVTDRASVANNNGAPRESPVVTVTSPMSEALAGAHL